MKSPLGSDEESDTFIQNNGLFPSMYSRHGLNNNNKNKVPSSSSPSTSSSPLAADSDNESVNTLRKVFNPRKQHASWLDLEMNEVDLSNYSPPSRVGTAALYEEEKEEEEGSNDDLPSLDSSVIDDLARNNEMDEPGRFKFVRMYEKLAKEKSKRNKARIILDKMKGNEDIPLQIMRSNSSSVFELSKLNDFEKFVKETALSDKIQGQVFSKLLPINPKEEKNTLKIVKESDLANNFYGGHDTSLTKGTKKRFLKHNFKKEQEAAAITEYVTKSDDEELFFSRSNSSKTQDDYDDDDDNNDDDDDDDNGASSQLLQRRLSVRHLQMISLGGTVGVGLFLNSGKAINIAGGFGAVLAFGIVGLVVLCTMMSFCEMVTFVSVIDGVSGLSSRFVDDAFGFATGWLYFFSFAFGVTGEVVAGVIMLSYFPNLQTMSNKGATTGFVTLFLASVLLSNLIDIRVYGEIEFVSSLIKLIWIVVMMIVMIILNRGGFGGPVIGFKYWDRSKSDFENNIIYGLFRPSFNLHDKGTSPPSDGIGGNTGRFLSLLTAILVVSYAYSGTEIVCIAACEAKNPRKALPSATKRVFWRIVIFYCLSAFLVTLNIYAGDPRLLRYYSGTTGISQEEFATNIAIQSVGGTHCDFDSTILAGYGSGAQSPWVVAFQSAGLCSFSTAASIFLVFFAVSCGNAQLYVSSRTIYALALQRKAPRFLTYCNKKGIPYNAVLFAGSFGLFSYTCVSQSATIVFQNLNSVISSTGIFVWFAMCLTFVRFYYGLRRRPDIIGRNHKSYPYRSPFQPYSAICGMVFTALIILSMGFVVFLKKEWDTMFFFSSYGPLMVFAALYAGYRVIKGTSIPSLDQLDFDSGRTEMDRYIWDGGTDYNKRNFKEVLYKWISFLV
ncbi:SSY1 [Candida oxycetoniae]|uniref:SSY1 n=1 Tax=Candida oxycetoniae TaxID=497107 RepID=A0AAI9T1K1_9ASCO|nr:SSY1 [Candida oxycetoniae]KAI3406737.2 SSY1 [Candida oxycetoniae]